ncbi:MAG: hypothetical protein ACRYFU_00655 [Janthinobacterium lividum]
MTRTSRRCTRSSPFLCTFALLCFAVGTAPGKAQGTTADEGPLQTNSDVTRAHALTNDTIIRMSKAGLDEHVILQTIKTEPGAYDTAPDDLIALKTAGISQHIIAAMQAHGAGLATRPNDTETVDPAPLAAGIDEIGVYYKDKDEMWVPLKTELVQFKSGGWLKSTATNNIVKQDLNGHVNGPKSPLVVNTGLQILIYAPAGTQPEEYEFVRFREHSSGREFRVKTGGVFHSETGSNRDEIEFHPQKISKQMYSFTVPNDIEKGEYGILPPGSSNTPGLATAGKIFTFSIRE